MPERSDLTEAFILHARKYRDTSVIVEMLTRKDGRVPAVVRGVRGRKSRIAGHVQPFARLLVSWIGRGELKTVRTMDFPWTPPSFSGDALITGLYVNELLVRLIGKYDPLPDVFDDYGPLIHKIALGVDMPGALRRFELLLLRELGYGITFESEARTGRPVQAEALYRYVPDEGFHRVGQNRADDAMVTGADLLAIREERFSEPNIDACAKRIIRSSFAVLLGGRKLKSRSLFRKLETPS